MYEGDGGRIRYGWIQRYKHRYNGWGNAMIVIDICLTNMQLRSYI